MSKQGYQIDLLQEDTEISDAARFFINELHGRGAIDNGLQTIDDNQSDDFIHATVYAMHTIQWEFKDKLTLNELQGAVYEALDYIGLS